MSLFNVGKWVLVGKGMQGRNKPIGLGTGVSSGFPFLPESTIVPVIIMGLKFSMEGRWHQSLSFWPVLEW